MKHLDYIVYNVHAVELEFVVEFGKYFVAVGCEDEDEYGLYKLKIKIDINLKRPVSLKWIILDFGLSTSVFCKYLGGCNISDFGL